jgi:hypothetical protein
MMESKPCAPGTYPPITSSCPRFNLQLTIRHYFPPAQLYTADLEYDGAQFLSRFCSIASVGVIR